MAVPAFLHPFASPGKDAAGYVRIVRGSGARVWDDTGKEYVDAMASLWYANLGFDNRVVIDAILKQAETLPAFQCFDPFTNAPADQLAETVASVAPVDGARVFFCGSGSEAVDSAMKMSRLAHARAGHPERQLIISRGQGYHGVNYGGTSAQGLPLNKEGYGELLSGVVQVSQHDLEAMATLFAECGTEIAAVLAEPLQGAGGVHPPVDGYLAGLRRLCDDHGAHLILDEVICGFGRLGAWFGAEHYGVRPDMITFAKAVTSGYVPLGGVVVGARVREPLEAEAGWLMRHGYTYSGHPLAAAAGVAALAETERLGLLDRARHVGARLEAGLRSLVSDGQLLAVRGDVAVWAAVMPDHLDAAAVRNRLLELGVITRPIPPAITFCPPLVITDREIDRIIDAGAEATR